MEKIKRKFDVLIEQNKTEEGSRLFNCDKIELIGNEIFIYKGKELIYKIWLKSDKWESYKDVKEAMKDVGISIIRF